MVQFVIRIIFRQCCKVTKSLYSSNVLKYKFEVLILKHFHFLLAYTPIPTRFKGKYCTLLHHIYLQPNMQTEFGDGKNNKYVIIYFIV